MAAAKIYLQYEPRLYSDLIQQVFQDIGQEVIVAQDPAKYADHEYALGEPDGGQFMLLSLENTDFPPGDLFTNLMPHATIIAFSPDGEFGFRRLPGDTNWVELRPFGLVELINEVLSEENQVRDQIPDLDSCS